MPNFASALKEEIVRLARKEIRIETEGFNKAKAQFRSETTALKHRVAVLEKQVARLSRKESKAQDANPNNGKEAKVRFRAKGLVTLRRRLGLSAAEFGLLAGVSAQTIYNWEAEKSRPHQQQIVALASLRGMGKKQATAKLGELQGK